VQHAQLGAHPRQHLAAIEGLGHIVRRAELQAADLLLGLIERRQEDDRHLGGLGVTLQLGADLEAVAPRHVDVQEDQLGRRLESGGERRVAVRDFRDLEALAGQNAPQQSTVHPAVVGDQDTVRGRGSDLEAGAHAAVPRRVP
jgi:hypothetical protein